MSASELTDTYSPAAVDKAPATRPATPARGPPAGYRAWDVLPDGRLVGLVDATDVDTNGSENTNELRVVVNWLAELDQLTTAN